VTKLAVHATVDNHEFVIGRKPDVEFYSIDKVIFSLLEAVQ